MNTAYNFYAGIETNTRERISLAPGSYGTSKQPGLKIQAYIEKASKLDKTGAMRHSFLVVATRPSREQLQAGTNGKAHAAGDNPLDTPDFEGTAFLSLTLHELWKAPESSILAFTEASRNKSGVIQKDKISEAIAAGITTQENIDRAIAHYKSVAFNKVTSLSVNTPEDKVEEATEKQYLKELNQIEIKVRNFMDLQDWKNSGDKTKRDINLDPALLVGTEFSGKVETANIGTGSEVASVYSRG